MRPLTPLLVVALALGLVCEGSAQDTPADNRYRTGDTYLQVETAQADLDARTVTLDVRWGASWRDAENWDAAWIVLKGQPSDGPLVPLRVRSEPAMTDNRSPDGAEAAFDVPDDRVGFFAYRAGRGEGENHWRVQVPWAAANGVDANTVEGGGDIYRAAPDGQTLIFAVWHPGGEGSGGLFMSRRENGGWTEAKNLSPMTNSSGRAYCPTVGPEGEWLYFTSSRTPGVENGQTPVTLEDMQSFYQQPMNGFGNACRVRLDAVR